MFLDNKYTKLYFKLIEAAKPRQTEGYVERHHIIPRSLGGSNDKTNIVRLTAREHYIAHLLLTKMTTGDAKFKMYCAAIRVTVHEKKNGQLYRKGCSRSYERIRSELSTHRSNLMKGNDFKKGKKDNDETRALKSASMQASEVQGRWIRTAEHRAALSEARKGKINLGERNSMASAENRAKVSASKIGRKRYYNEAGQFKYCMPGTEPEGYRARS